MRRRNGCMRRCWGIGARMSSGRLPVLGYTVRQCRICHRILRWPILDMADAVALNYTHCAPDGDLVGTEFLEIVPRLERLPVCEVSEEVQS